MSLSFIQVGCGGWGARWVAEFMPPLVFDARRAVPAAVVDIKADVARAAAEAYRLPPQHAYTDAAEAFRKHGDADFAMAVQESLKLPAAHAARLLVDHGSQDWRDLIEHVIPTLKLPTLVFGGELASIFPPQAAAWIAAQIPGAELSIFTAAEGGSHFMFWENPEKFNAVLRRFLG